MKDVPFEDIIAFLLSFSFLSATFLIYLSGLVRVGFVVVFVLQVCTTGIKISGILVILRTSYSEQGLLNFDISWYYCKDIL